jgi:RHS repeat-associated protein
MLTQTAKRYYYDDQRIALQTSVSGSTETDEKYFLFGNYIDEVLLMHTLAGTYTGDFYYGHDHLYSPTALFESDGDVVERYEYDVYGACRILDSGYSLLSSSQYANPYYFTGRELDSMNGGSCKIMYYRARSYDPQTGRFLQRDKLGVIPAGSILNPFSIRRQYSDGMNLYEYVGSSSLGKKDPFGLSSNCGCENAVNNALNDPDMKRYYDKAKNKRDFWGPCVRKVKCKECDASLTGYYDSFSRNLFVSRILI